MPEAPRRPRGLAALLFAVAALASCWNPVAAPFGLAVGIGAAVLGLLARRKGAPRGRATAAVTLGAVAAVASAAVLALSAGSVTGDIPGTPVVKGRSTDEATRVLDDAAARTRAERERALQELKSLDRGTPEGQGNPTAAPAPRPNDEHRR